jgi:nitric oxide reductase NorD protein
VTDEHGSSSPGVVEFTDVQHVLGLFADGIAGVATQLEPADDPRSVWPWGTTLPDGSTMRLPASIDDFASSRDNRSAYRASVLHQAGYAEFGTLDFTTAELDGRPAQAAGRPAQADDPPPGAAAGEQRSELLDLFARARQPALLREVFTMLEDLRIDAATRRRYPGARADLERLLALARDHRGAAAQPDRQNQLLDALKRRSLGAGRAELRGVHVGVVAGDRAAVEWMVTRAESLEAPSATVYDTVHAALAISALVEGAEVADVEATYAGIVTDTVDEGSGGDADPDEDAEGRPHEAGQPPSVGKEDHGADTAELGGQPADVLAHERQADEEEEPDLESAGRPGQRARDATTDLDGARVYFYDEWDYRRQAHLPGWCRVIERRLSGDDFAFIGDVRRRYSILASRLRRQFAFIRPTGWVRVHRSDDGDELDLDAVIEAVVDRRTGHAANERLHIRRDRAARDVATAFLVDLSASTGSAIRPPEPPPVEPEDPDDPGYRFAATDPWDLDPPSPESQRRVLDIAKESVALMCDALQLLGDRHAVYGFSGEGRDRVEFHVAKEFNDRTSPSTWAALAAMQPRRYTRMGPAIRHATAKIAAQPTKTKLLIVISDGYPQDVDYGPDRADKEYGLQDTARALRDATDAGIATYCVTIDPAGHDYLRRMCPDQSYIVIDDVPSLPGELAKLYGSLATHSKRRAEQD